MHKGFYAWKQINSDSIAGSFKEIWRFLASGLVFFFAISRLLRKIVVKKS